MAASSSRTCPLRTQAAPTHECWRTSPSPLRPVGGVLYCVVLCCIVLWWWLADVQVCPACLHMRRASSGLRPSLAGCVSGWGGGGVCVAGGWWVASVLRPGVGAQEGRPAALRIFDPTTPTPLRPGAGETVAFVGPSGSGKSTICAMIQKQYRPLVGSAFQRDRPPRARRAHTPFCDVSPVEGAGLCGAVHAPMLLTRCV